MSSSAALPPRPRPPVALGVLGLHLALLALLLQADLLHTVLPEVQPVAVALLQRPAAPPAVPTTTSTRLPEPVRAPAPALPLLPPPVLDLREALPQPAAVHAPQPAAVAETAPALVLPAASTTPAPAPPAPAAPSTPPEPRQLPPGAIGYRVPPAVAVPLASRRLRESGTVWLRVRVDRQGLPVQVSVHRSSGFPRLDEQALAAMQAARFIPQTDNGQPIEWVVIAPLAYDTD